MIFAHEHSRIVRWLFDRELLPELAEAPCVNKQAFVHNRKAVVSSLKEKNVWRNCEKRLKGSAESWMMP